MIAHAFIRQAAHATCFGLLQGYETLNEARPIVRGRIDIPAQINRRASLPIPLQITFDEYSANIAENQLLLAAAHRLLHIPSLSQQARPDSGN